MSEGEHVEGSAVSTSVAEGLRRHVQTVPWDPLGLGQLARGNVRY